METNLILCGVGGQGILSISYVIDMAALGQGLHFKQAEVHGMSQRGGEVVSHLRVSDRPLWSDLVPKGRGDIVLSIEPLESLRYLSYLSPQGVVVSGADSYINIPDYPEPATLQQTVGGLPRVALIPAERLARSAGSARAQNMVLLGAASPYLGLSQETLEAAISQTFARKGERVQTINLCAFRAGLAAGLAYRACREAGIGVSETLLLTGSLRGGVLQAEAVSLWKQLFAGPLCSALQEALRGAGRDRLEGSETLARTLLGQSGASVEGLRQLLFGASGA